MIYLKLNPINSPMMSAWTRENFHRNYILTGLKDAKLSDVIYIGDIDEIPRKEIFSIFKPEYGVSIVAQRLSYYFVNCVHDAPWARAQIMTKETLMMSSPNTIRYEHVPSIIHNGGWHFSYLGGVDKIIEKIEAYSHSEFNDAKFKDKKHLEECLKTGKDFLCREGLKFTIQPLDDSYPKYLLENQKKFKHLIAEVA